MQDLDRLIRTIEEAAAHGKDAAKELKPFYEKKVRPDKDAIKNLEALQANRPLKPPGRS